VAHGAGLRQARPLGSQDEKITEYQDTVRKHTIRIDPKTGAVWSTGSLTRFDPKTEKFDHIPDVPTSYGIDLDAEGNAGSPSSCQTARLAKSTPRR
jgi:streptogramin lyase